IVDYVLISIRIAVERSNLASLDTLSLVSIHPGATLYLNPVMGFGALPNSVKRWKRIENLTICMDSIPFTPYPPSDHLKLLHSYLQLFASSVTDFVFRWQGVKGLSPLSLDKEVCLQKSSPDMACPRRCHLALLPLKFEKLRKMEVENLVVDASQISSFITAHRYTIRDFNFEDTHLRSGDWDQALTPLTRISGSEKWKEKAEEVMDVPLLLDPVGLEEKRVNEALVDYSNCKPRPSRPSIGAWQKAGSRSRELFGGTPEHFRRFLRTSTYFHYPNTTVTMSLKNDSFPSSTAFDAINSSLQSDDAERKDAVKKGNAIFAFTLKNKEGHEESWHIDLKDKGCVGRGPAPEGKKADVTLSLSDEEFAKMVAGKTQAQRLFMSGKLKIKGDVMKATKMEPVLKKAQTAKPKLSSAVDPSRHHSIPSAQAMSKRSADTERIGDEDGFRSTAPSGEPQTQRATAAQLAARNPYAKKVLNRTVPNKRRIRMARPRQGRRPGAQARPLTPQASPLSQSFPAPSWGTNPSASSASMQQPSGSFTFGQQPGGFSSSPNSAGSNPSFPSFGGQNNDSNQQFTAPSSAGFNFAAPPTTSNPFAGMNQQSQQPTFTSGFSGSIFNLPPQTPAAPEQPSERPPSEMRTPSHWMKNIPEAYQESDPQSFFVPNAPFKWGQPDPPQQEQSLQATSNTEASAAAQQVAQPSSAHPFTQNSPQKQSTNDIFAHLQQPSSTSPNPFAQQPARQFQTTNIFGQHPASSPSQPSQPASTFFGQPSTSQDSSSTNIFSKPAISPTKDGDRMATTPDTSPQASNERAHLGPFASVSASSMNALANGTAPAGPASSIFGSSFQPSAGGGLTNGKTPKESAFSEDLQRNDNDQASNVSLGSPTKKPRGMTQPRTEPPQAEEEAPLQKDNPFSAIKFPAPNAQTPTPSFSFSQSPIFNQGASVARPQANGKTLALSAKPTATGSVLTQHSRGSREPGMPPQAPADFTEEQKRQLITGWRLKSLDVGMQSYLRYSTFDQNEIDCVKRFYEQRKRAILDANGGPLPEIGNKRAAGSQGGLPSKKARLNETSTAVERQIQSLNQSAAGKSSPGKRKASEDLLENDDGTSSNGLKKSKTNDQVAYPSLPTSSTNSQTSKLFGNLVGKKSMETSSGNSNPAVNGHLPTEAGPTDIAQSSNASPSQPGSFPKLQYSSPSASARPLFPNKDKPISAFGFGQEPTSTPLQSKTGNQNTVDQATSAQSGAPFKGFVPSPAKLSSNTIPSQGFFASERSQGNSATTASSTTPTIAQGSGGVQQTSNASSFSGPSADAAKSVNAKRKADEFTEGEGDGGQASPQKSEEQRSKKQKAGEEPIDFTPSEKREASIFRTQATGGLTGFGHSVLARPSPPPTNASNIFGHLTQPTEQHGIDTSDIPDREDDEDTRESQQVMEHQNASSDA
ncbi:MAG: hypothetical protein Q9177_005213, partial [Variospora cf. flavescens]